MSLFALAAELHEHESVYGDKYNYNVYVSFSLPKKLWPIIVTVILSQLH